MEMKLVLLWLLWLKTKLIKVIVIIVKSWISRWMESNENCTYFKHKQSKCDSKPCYVKTFK